MVDKLIKWWEGRRVKSRLVDLIEMSMRQAADDRQSNRDLVIALAQANTDTHARLAEVVREVSATVKESGASFNRYLDLVGAGGENRVRVMTDAEEARLEREVMGERLGADRRDAHPFHSELLDSVSRQDEVGQLLKQFMAADPIPPSLEPVPPPTSFDLDRIMAEVTSGAPTP